MRAGLAEIRFSLTRMIDAMTSRFHILADLIRSPKADDRQPVERPKSAEDDRREREAYRAQSRADMAYGRRTFLEQQVKQAAREPPREENYEAWCTLMAHRITDAGRRARGLKPLFSDDREPSDEYPDRDNYNSPGKDPDDGGDDSPNPKDKKVKKKAKPAKADDDDEQAEGDDKNENGETKAQYWARVNRTANAIIQAGRRRRGEL
jgi:hypothetical protein